MATKLMSHAERNRLLRRANLQADKRKKTLWGMLPDTNAVKVLNFCKDELKLPARQIRNVLEDAISINRSVSHIMDGRQLSD